MTHVFTSQKGNHRGSEILERFLNAEVVSIPVFSGRERHFEKRRIGRDCWPCRLKFNMADVSKHVIILDRNIFRVYQLISHNIFILMFCGSLVQCKISVGCSCCTRVSRNGFFSQFFPNKRHKKTQNKQIFKQYFWRRRIAIIPCIYRDDTRIYESKG